MERYDQGMAFMLQYENVAWYEEGKVRILDRRVYPTEIRYVYCNSYTEVSQAIADMVTQSAGPYTAAGMGMALAAYECRHMDKNSQIEFLRNAGNVIANSRPTTANRLRIVTDGCIKSGYDAILKGESAVDAIFKRTIESLNRRYKTMSVVGDYLADLFPKKGVVLTQCFGETIIGTMLRSAKEKNKDVSIICAETRPYLQGARLTSSCCHEMGFDTTVITDNMVSYVMQNKGVDIFTSAADTIARDGHIANKIGSFQMAILAKYFGIPYFVTGIPDRDKLSGKDIIIEERDPELVLKYRGILNTLEGVKGLYPSFDVVPPHLISGIITDKGIYTPYNVDDYFSTETGEFY